MYTLTKNSNQIRRDADGVIFNCMDGLLCYEQYKLWLADGNVPSPASLADQARAIEDAFDAHIDAVAAAHGYGRIGLSPSAACIGYAAYPNQWQAEAIKYGQWVADCVAYLIQEQAKVAAGARTMPTPSAAISELPTMIW